MLLPTGTVIFLFTDIEGSTKLWEERPEAMRLALARHDSLLRSAIETNNGVVFRTIGDAFCAAFATAPDALAAALDAQRALISESGNESLLLLVRIALHTGAAELREGDYFGQPLNRVARLLAVAHGGQVILSDVSHDLARDTMPASATLRSLGEHRLRDLGRPEAVYQLLHPDLPADFPPLRSLDNPELPNNLPRQVTSFIGRKKEIAAVQSLLAKTRLLTLTGAGGCGKTRLSLQVAADVLDEYPDGTWLVEFAPLTDPALVPQTVAAILRLRERERASPTQTLTDALKNKHLLLVLDNCEHLIAACAGIADALLRACPGVHLLATSREPLAIAGELTYRVPPLSIPDEKAAATPESLSQYEAACLFIERASFHKPDFAVTNRNAPALAAVCSRLDGIPLAIELAAARTRSLSLEEINDRLNDVFRLLTGGSRTALPRQQTLRAAIDWSYILLTDAEKTLLQRLSAFADGWTLEAAERVCAGDGIEDGQVLDYLTSLTDKSLTVAVEREGATRYRFLETIRQYAAEKLVTSGEADALRHRHQGYFLQWGEAMGNWRRLGPDVTRLTPEIGNLRAALEYCLTTEDRAEEGLRFVNILRAMAQNSHVSGLREYAARALAHPGVVPSAVWWDIRVQQITDNSAIKAISDIEAIAFLREKCLPAYRALNDTVGEIIALGRLAWCYLSTGDSTNFDAHIERAIALSREIDYRPWLPNLLCTAAHKRLKTKERPEALALFEEAHTLDMEDGHDYGAARSYVGLAALEMGRLDYAGAVFRECVPFYRKGATGLLDSVFAGLARVAEAQGRWERAARLLGMAYHNVETAYDITLNPFEAAGNLLSVAEVKKALGAEAFEAAFAAGRALTPEQADAYALAPDL